VIFYNASTSYVHLVCSLDPIIPTTTMILWFDRSNTFAPSPPNRVLETNDTTTMITIVDPKLPDEGDYVCFFTGTGLNFHRTITLG